jgi:3-hydroxyisobutyrate dehydrogenase
MLDCPVSGGPEKAEMGNLTSMVSGNIDEYHKIKYYINLFSNTNYTGPIGSAHAIKSINNLLNVSNLIIANEGINALSKLGIEPEIALSVINKSSGRSLMTEERLPMNVLNGKFNYGFKLNLMQKDTDLALNLINNKEYFEPIIKKINKTLENNTEDCDYTYVFKK